MIDAKKTRRGAIVLRKSTAASRAITVTLLCFAALTVLGFFFIGNNGRDFFPQLAEFFRLVGKMFFSPNPALLTLDGVLGEILVTFGMAFLTTLIGAVFALFLSLMAAQNLVPKWLTWVTKSWVALIRAIPTQIWVLIFAIGAGLGSTAAVVGMTFHTIGYLIKAYAESFEELDHGVIEALKAGGATWWQIVFRAVLPSCMNAILSWTFIRFEINFATAVAMGAVAGANGIGYDVFVAGGFHANIQEVGFIAWFILAFAVALEIGATKLRERFHLKS